jgi:hypothetical protein
MISGQERCQIQLIGQAQLTGRALSLTQKEIPDSVSALWIPSPFSLTQRRGFEIRFSFRMFDGSLCIFPDSRSIAASSNSLLVPIDLVSKKL